MGMESPSVQLAAAKLVSECLKVNVSVVRAIATDQVQRHASFDKQDEAQAAKFQALEQMTDEELEVLEKLSIKAGGTLPIKEAE